MRDEGDASAIFWAEVRREAEDGETVIVARGLSRVKPETWIAISDRLPPNAMEVLAWDDDPEVPGVVVARYHYLTKDWTTSETAPCNLTHWMPLPEGPA